MERESAIVTGGGRGIGRATSLDLAGAGYDVAVLDIDASDASETAEEIESTDAEALALEADVADPEAVERAIATAAAEFGGLDVAVHNAGIQTQRAFMELPVEDWDRVIDVNLRGAFLVGQHAAAEMAAQGTGGRIVNVTSVHQWVPRRDHSHYDASKAGIRMLTRDMAYELAPEGITVNCVAPGAITTPMNRDLLENADDRDAVSEMIPAGRWGQPEEIARAIRFLAASESAYITGACLTVDGGLGLAGLGWP